MKSFGGTLAKITLIIFNSIFALSGAGILAAGIWFKVNPDVGNLKDLIQPYIDAQALNYAAYALMGFGSLVLLISLLGFCGSISENKLLLALYIGFLLLVFIGEFSAGIAAAVYKGQLIDILNDDVTSGFRTYYPQTVGAWDEFQNDLSCCGWSNFTNYYNVTVKDNKNVPDSCCKTVGANCQNDAANWKYDPAQNYTYLNAGGCFDAVKDMAENNIGIIIGAGIGVAFIQILGMVLACCVCRGENGVESMKMI